MEGAKENEPVALATLSAPGDSIPVKPSALTPLSAGKRASIGEDDGGSAEAKLFGKGLAATSLLQIAIRNGIYQNQVGHAAKNGPVAAVKTASLYGGSPGGSSSLLARRRHRHRRNLSLGAPPTGSSAGPPAEAVGPAPSASPLSTLSLDRRTFLRQKQSKQLQASDRTWVRSDLRRGCIHVHDWLTPSHPRPVLLSVDTTAKEVAGRLEASKAGAALRMECRTCPWLGLADGAEEPKDGQDDEGDGLSDGVGEAGVGEAGVGEAETAQLRPSLLDDKTASNSSSELCLNDVGVDLSVAGLSVADWAHSGSDLESSTCEDFSPGASRSAELQDSTSDGLGQATDSSAPSLNCDSATEGPDPFQSSSDELDLTSSPTHSASQCPAEPSQEVHTPTHEEPGPGDAPSPSKMNRLSSKGRRSPQTRSLTSPVSVPPDPETPRGGRGWTEPISTCPTPALFIQLHGGTVRRLGDDERPLQILNEYLTNLGYQDPSRVQGDGMNPEIGCLIRFYFGENVQMSGTTVSCCLT